MKIDTALVERLVATQFPQWAHLPIEPVAFGGWDNRTFHLGAHLSVRLPSAERYAAQVDKEHRWLPELAPLLPLPIPVPLAKGMPGENYPWSWSIYRWLDGEGANIGRIGDLAVFAADLADFLLALQKIDASGGPAAGKHNFFRGGSLQVYAAETCDAAGALAGEIDSGLVHAVWDAALASEWHRAPVWVHGDVSASNLLVREGRLSAVIDFGSSGVGDPACDLVIAWTFLEGESRDTFRRILSLDRATWARARGWALWKALITLVQHRSTNDAEANRALSIIEAVLADHNAAGA